MANQADVADIERAGDAVYAELERDRQTRSFIAQIRRMKAAIGPRTTPPAPCGTVARGAPKGTSSP
jgi:hypothetical protein